jgi:large-conductance mechanosensitive channel
MENNIIQEIIAFTFLAISIGFLIKKYFWKKKKSDKNCGKDDCGCS